MKPLDPRELVLRNSVVYRCLTPAPAQSLYFANGIVGGSVHTPDDSLYLLIQRSDTWLPNACMGSIAAVRIRGRAGLFTKAARVRQVMDLYHANVTITLWPGASDEAVTFTITCPRGDLGFVLIDVHDTTAHPTPLDITIENWHEVDELRTIAPEPQYPGCIGLITSHTNTTSQFRAINQRALIDADALGIADPLLGRAWALSVATYASGSQITDRTLRLPGAPRQRVVIATASVEPAPGLAPRDAQAIAASGVQSGSYYSINADSWIERHRKSWADFWSKSHLTLRSASGDAEYEERLWYVNLYLLAAGMHDEASDRHFPPRFNGGPYLLDRDTRGWDGGYWFQNMRLMYWPLIASGHAEFMRPFLDLYLNPDNQKLVRQQSKNFFGIDALAFRETQTFWGVTPDHDLAAKRFTPHTYNNFSSSLEVCLMMDWYRLSGSDEHAEFLAEHLYPTLRDVVEFFLQYARKGDDGKYHLSPANALEVWPDAIDPAQDIAGLNYLLPKLIRWGTQFGAPPEKIAQWREFLANFAPLPIGRWKTECEFQDHIHEHEYLIEAVADPKGIFLPAAGVTGERPKRINMENPEFYAVFPWGMLGLDSPASEQRRFEVTWHHRTWQLLNNGWSQDVPQLARMGWSEQAKTASLEHASYNQRFPSGAFISPAGAHFHGLLTAHLYLDSAGVHLAGINEMLLQSYNGVLRIAPAVSSEWSGAYSLHGLEGFHVEATFSQGRPLTATITATRSTTLKVRNHSRAVMHVVHQGRSIDTPFGELFEAPAVPDDVTQLRWDNPADPRETNQLRPEARPEVIYPGYKLRPPTAAHPTGHWHDERKGHGQIGLAEDGLFPATRPVA